MTMARKRKHSGDFDPTASLNELISALEQKTGFRIGGEPSTAWAAILPQVHESFGKFERAVTSLHAAGQVAAVGLCRNIYAQPAPVPLCPHGGDPTTSR